MHIDLVIKFARQSTEDGGVSDIGPAQSAAGQSTEVAVLRDQDYLFPHPSGLDGSCDPTGGIAVDNDVCLVSVSRRGRSCDGTDTKHSEKNGTGDSPGPSK